MQKMDGYCRMFVWGMCSRKKLGAISQGVEEKAFINHI